MIAVRVLTGIQAGVLGGLVSLVWLWWMSYLTTDSPWQIFNVSARLFYGPRAPRFGFGYPTLAGVAFHLLAAAGAGIGLALLARRSWGWSRSLVWSALYMLLLQASVNEWIWRVWNPSLLRLVSPLTVWGAAATLALAFSLIPWLLRSMEREFLLN